MTKSVVVVHDDPVFIERVVEALRRAGHAVVVFPEPLAALHTLDDPGSDANLLITRAQFPVGKSNGIALARMTRSKRPDMKVLITGKEHLAEFAEGLAEFLPHPVDINELVAAAERLLIEQERDGSRAAA